MLVLPLVGSGINHQHDPFWRMLSEAITGDGGVILRGKNEGCVVLDTV